MAKTRAEKAAYLREWKRRNPEKVAEYAKRDRAKHPERFKRHSLAYRERNLEGVREKERIGAAQRRAGKPDWYRRQKAKQKTAYAAKLERLAGRIRPKVCEICGEFHRWIVFDHCHATGKFRGWLCDRCNKTLGHVYDSPGLLRKLADYLEAHSGKVIDQEAA